jgi:hypothetical protein
LQLRGRGRPDWPQINESHESIVMRAIRATTLAVIFGGFQAVVFRLSLFACRFQSVTAPTLLEETSRAYFASAPRV